MKIVSSYSSYGSSSKTYDEGLRTYMTSVFKYMSISLILTGLVAYMVANVPFLYRLIFGTPLYIVVALSPLLFVLYFGAKIWSISPERARNYLWAYAALIGISLSSIFLAYTGISITRTFFVASATFGAMALYGNTTKKDLTGIGSFMVMGLYGLIIASLVNIFLKSPGVEFATSILGVLIFTGLTAWDMQKIKNSYSHVGVNSDVKEKVAIIGALQLYMDFINIFLYLLRFLGDRRD
ncbi:MAG: Bax inhibitor-1/YccA family protein [Rickettsiales bacterium]|jgi:FtsH-binding integral membrane protein|nr:Bax inhibitor-1/YccA family protein [Rickettsiales bacterium]